MGIFTAGIKEYAVAADTIGITFLVLTVATAALAGTAARASKTAEQINQSIATRP